MVSQAYERVTGVEPVSVPWEGTVRPFNYTRKEKYSTSIIISPRLPDFSASSDYLSGQDQNISCVDDIRICQFICFSYFNPFVTVAVSSYCNIPKCISLNHCVGFVDY